MLDPQTGHAARALIRALDETGVGQRAVGKNEQRPVAMAISRREQKVPDRRNVDAMRLQIVHDYPPKVDPNPSAGSPD